MLGGRGRVEAVVRSKAEASSTASRTMVIKRTVLGTEDHLLSHGELRFPPPALETGLRASYKQKPERDTAGSSPRQLIHPDSKPAEPPVLAYVLGVSAACREWEASAALGYKVRKEKDEEGRAYRHLYRPPSVLPHCLPSHPHTSPNPLYTSSCRLMYALL